jgi:hypothetical protein
MTSRILVGQQWKRDGFFVWPVTRRAPFEQNRRDVFGERRVSDDGVRAGARPTGGQARRDEQNGGASQRAASVAAAFIG